MDGSLEYQIYEELRKKGLTITTAESCTGGLVAGTLINVGGISDYLKEAYITYCDEAKKKLLGVSEDTLLKYTAVSAKTAGEMALGGAKAADADICLSVTGIAGPGGGNEEFPVGLVYTGCAICGKVSVKKHIFSGDRQEVRKQAVTAVLQQLLDDLHAPE